MERLIPIILGDRRLFQIAALLDDSLSTAIRVDMSNYPTPFDVASNRTKKKNATKPEID